MEVLTQIGFRLNFWRTYPTKSRLKVTLNLSHLLTSFIKMKFKEDTCAESDADYSLKLTGQIFGENIPEYIQEEEFFPIKKSSDEDEYEAEAQEYEYDSEEEEENEPTHITPELMRKCVADYDYFDSLSFEIKEQLIDDLTDAISMCNAPKQYYTRSAFKILLERLDIDPAPSANWIASILMLFYLRKRIDIEDIDFEAVYERINDWPLISPFLQSMLDTIAATLELNQE